MKRWPVALVCLMVAGLAGGLLFSNAWQPQISTVTSPLVLGSSLAISGSGFRGISEGSGGNGPQGTRSRLVHGWARYSEGKRQEWTN